MTGIYIIRNLIDGKVYIGQSTNIEKRLRDHKSYLRRGQHHNILLQRSFCKYGEGAFSFDVLSECVAEELDLYEKTWIAFYRSTSKDGGYNLDTGGLSFRKVSDETHQRMSIAQKNRKPCSDETRRRLSEARKRQAPHFHSDEELKKMSEVQKGHFVSDETRIKLSEATKRQWARKRGQL